MVIWRGWGILAAIYIGAAMILFGGLASTVLPETALPLTIALGLALAAVGIWFTGRAMNTTGPQRRVEAWASARREQLDSLVADGRFSLGPGQPQPRSREEAQAQSDALYEHELAQARTAGNQHTLFFVPMQYWAFIIGAAAVVVLVIGLVGLAGS